MIVRVYSKKPDLVSYKAVILSFHVYFGFLYVWIMFSRTYWYRLDQFLKPLKISKWRPMERKLKSIQLLKRKGSALLLTCLARFLRQFSDITCIKNDLLKIAHVDKLWLWAADVYIPHACKPYLECLRNTPISCACEQSCFVVALKILSCIINQCSCWFAWSTSLLTKMKMVAL